MAASAFGPAGPPQGNLLFQGYYVEALVFLTGESREWDQCNFIFKRVTPRRPVRFSGDSGYGAWELGVRYSFLDLSHKAIRAGELQGVTVGVNWYMNANAKMQFNYDYTHRGNTNTPAQGHVHAFGTRMALDF
jgi:phosphate-selective porin OprO/OprP